MSLRKRIDKLHTYADDLNAMQEKHDKEIKKINSKLNFVSNTTRNTDDFATSLQKMLDLMETEKKFFIEQIDLIKTMSPLMSDHMDYLFSSFEDVQQDIIDEIEDRGLLKSGRVHHDIMDAIKYIDELVHERTMCYNDLYDTISVSYLCFGGMLNYIEGFDAKDYQEGKKNLPRFIWTKSEDV